MKRKFGQPSLPTLFFRPDGVLTVPGYTFSKVRILFSTILRHTKQWTGSTMAGYREYDNACRRKQLERWLIDVGKDMPFSFECVYVLGKRSPYVRPA